MREAGRPPRATSRLPVRVSTTSPSTEWLKTEATSRKCLSIDEMVHHSEGCLEYVP